MPQALTVTPEEHEAIGRVSSPLFMYSFFFGLFNLECVPNELLVVI